MAKWKDHRTAVRESLKRRGESVAWLLEELNKGAAPKDRHTRQHLYAYLRGDHGISVELQARINEILSLRFTDE